MAEVALLRDIPVFIIRDGIIRAFLNAGLTPGTQVVIHDDNAVVSFADGCLRTGIGTGRFIAVTAQVDLKGKFRPIIDLPRAVFPNCNQPNAPGRPVFLLAGHFTGPATPTKVIVYT